MSPNTTQSSDPSPQIALTDATVTLSDVELAVSSIEFDAGEVVLRRRDWNEDALKTMREPFRDGDVQTLTITLPDRRFEYPVQAPTERRSLDSDGPAVEMIYTVPGGGYCRSFVGAAADN